VSWVRNGLEVFASVPIYRNDDGDAVPLRLHEKGCFVAFDEGNGGRLRQLPRHAVPHAPHRLNAFTRIDVGDRTDAADLDELRRFSILRSA
jgi:hypothetical protein